jgi:hypothetical protein
MDLHVRGKETKADTVAGLTNPGAVTVTRIHNTIKSPIIL